jgi:hypothetical protein
MNTSAIGAVLFRLEVDTCLLRHYQYHVNKLPIHGLNYVDLIAQTTRLLWLRQNCSWPPTTDYHERFSMPLQHLAGIPRKVLLFSGHMIDAPGRPQPRFPADKEAVATEAIASVLDRIHAQPGDLAICGGACGGDLLFAEAALARRLRLEIYIPFAEPRFLLESVDFADADWRRRFFEVKSQASLHVMPEELGPPPGNDDPYERDNLWMLEAAMRFGSKNVDFICLWNGEGGDGPGGTQHLMKEVQIKGGRIYWLDTRQLWN